MSAKELRDKLKSLRSEHSGKAISKMTADEMAKEIEHHEMACKMREKKEAMKKARESKKTVKKEEYPETSEDEKPKTETIKSRITKKKSPSEE